VNLVDRFAFGDDVADGAQQFDAGRHVRGAPANLATRAMRQQSISRMRPSAGDGTTWRCGAAGGRVFAPCASTMRVKTRSAAPESSACCAAR